MYSLFVYVLLTYVFLKTSYVYETWNTGLSRNSVHYAHKSDSRRALAVNKTHSHYLPLFVQTKVSKGRTRVPTVATC